MSDQPDDSQKTEEPTSQKLAKAREKGQVATSREVNTWAILFGAAIMLGMMAPSIFTDLRIILLKFIEIPHQVSFDKGALGAYLSKIVFDIIKILIWPFGMFVILALASGLAQTGLIFSAEQMKPKLEKFSLIKGVKRWFGVKNMVEFFKGILKIVIVATIGIILLTPEAKRLEIIPTLYIGDVLNEIHELVMLVLIGSLAILFIIAIADLVFQRMQHIKQLKMTKQEIKDEFKNAEGDPHIKAKLRHIRAEKARQRMMQSIPNADVIVTNPTHFAIALSYVPEEMDAPVVVGKGQDIVAKRIRDIAEEHNIPIVENAPLARALYASVDIDDTVPQEHFKVVAEIISYVFNLKNRNMP